ncbi:MAG: DNA-deoxyinosine glycosylase [Candidatus Thiodiazotropha sp. DIVDIV]
MTKVTSFNPIIGHSPKVLILGSMPGRASLDANEYYAYPRNSFWRIMGEIIRFPPSLPYPAKLEALKSSGVALWDVLHSCIRPGSSDSAIQPNTRVPNTFNKLFHNNPSITIVCFNGREAETSYKKFVLPKLENDDVQYLCLPSTSPAYAALSFEKKLVAWKLAISSHLEES